jgi:thiamine-phosphate pyrophosphorylase
VQKIWLQAGHSSRALVSVSCHSALEVARAASGGADFAVFAPVFEKMGTQASPAGLGGLREACRQKVPVVALGGVTLKNALACLDAGAAGVAAIRLFQENDIAEVVRDLGA